MNYTSGGQVIIGLTILAYRHEGLRFSDSITLVQHCKQALMREVGPMQDRPTHALYGSWLKNSALLLGSLRPSSVSPTVESSPIPLQFCRLDDDREMKRVHGSLTHYPPAAMHMLQQLVFPSLMKHQDAKISASGADLGTCVCAICEIVFTCQAHFARWFAGSSMLFGVRLGFSGTPSDLLPDELGGCRYEPGSQAQIGTFPSSS